MMICAHEKILDIVIIKGLHPADSLPAPVLLPEIFRRHALDIAKARGGYHNVIIRNEVFIVQGIVKGKLRPALLSEFLL